MRTPWTALLVNKRIGEARAAAMMEGQGPHRAFCYGKRSAAWSIGARGAVRGTSGSEEFGGVTALATGDAGRRVTALAYGAAALRDLSKERKLCTGERPKRSWSKRLGESGRPGSPANARPAAEQGVAADEAHGGW